jgi:hypothetical protein
MHWILKAPDPAEVFSRPVIWAGRNLLFYGIVASIAAGGFLVSARVHSYLNPIEAKREAPSDQPERKLTPLPASPTKLTPADSSDEILISGLGTFPVEKLLGLTVSAQKDESKIGAVKGLLTADNGQTFAAVQLGSFLGLRADEVIVPTKRLIWKKSAKGSLEVYLPESTIRDVKILAAQGNNGTTGGGASPKEPAMWLRY